MLVASLGTALALDITTVTGQTFHNVTVTRVEKTGIGISHSEGTAFLAFSILPENIRNAFLQAEADPDAVLPSAELAHSSEIMTLDGNVYRDVTITRIERSGIRISHRDGIGFLDFLILPIPLRNRYGYTEEKYMAGKAVREQKGAESQARISAVAAARELDAQRRRSEAQAAAQLAAERAQAAIAQQQQRSIATRDYSNSDHSTRDYDSNRYSGGGYTGGGTVHVSGYTRKNGTYVRPYTRRR